jgi:hypothetical protein
MNDDGAMSVQTVAEPPEFIRRTRPAGMADEDKAELISALGGDRQAGVSPGGGLRKVRVARAGSGKSSRYRVIRSRRSPDMPLCLYLLIVCARNERVNISPAERAELIELCDLIADTYGN